MCRLLGVVSTAPIAVEDAVGANVLKDFVALTKIHGDGWGIARVARQGRPPEVQVSAASALDDPAFASVTQDLRSNASLVHLRWATSGLAVAATEFASFRCARVWPWRTTVRSSRSTGWTRFWIPRSLRAWVAPPTVSGTSR